MAHGFKLINDAGTFQIDDNYFNFVNTSKFTVTSSAPSGGYVIWNVEYSGNYPIVAMRCQSGEPIYVMGVNAIGVGTPPDPNKRYIYLRTPASSVKYLDVYVFDIVPPGSTLPQYGFAVFRADGLCVFHSDCKPMRLAATPEMIRFWNGFTFPINPARVYAMAFLHPNNGLCSSPDQHQVWRMGISHPAGASVATYTHNVEIDYGGGTISPFENGGNAFLVDVTNY